MLEYVPIKEFQKFLLAHGVVWDGKVFKEKDGKYKKVEMQTSDYGYRYRGGLSITAGVSNRYDKPFVMMVDETNLLLYKHVGVFDDLELVLDLSDEWIDHLVSNHVWQYGPIIMVYATDKIEKSKKQTYDKVLELRNKIRKIKREIDKAEQEHENKTKKWIEIMKKAKTKYSNM